MQNQDDALICAAVLNSKGGARELHWEDIDNWHPRDGKLWLHFQFDQPRAREWLTERSGLDPLVINALLMDETRPRAVVAPEGLLLILRGVNLNPGADPDDMVSVRIWADDDRVITIRRRRLMAIQDLMDQLAAGSGPRSVGEIIVQLTSNLTTRMRPVITQIGETLESLEEEALERRDAEIRSKLSDIRHRVIRLRRYISPQRDTYMQLATERIRWFRTGDRAAMREVAFAITRHVEDLDMAREQAIVMQDELTAYVNEQLGRTMYFLALVTTFFLPITFITGLLGMNVGGLPADKHPNAFGLVLVVMAVLVFIQVWIFRRWRLMK